MISRLFFTIFILFFITLNPVCAMEKFVVELVNDIDAANPPQECSLRAIDDIYITYYDKIEKDGIITGKIVKIVPPKRWERDAFIVFKPEKYTIPSENNKEVGLIHNKKVKLRNKKRLDKKEVAANAIGCALSKFPPFSIAVPVFQFGLGAVKHKEDEHPLHGGCRYLVESWPFYYFLKGDELVLTAGTKMKLPLSEKMFNFNKKQKL